MAKQDVAAAKLWRDIGRNHMTVSAITGYFQTKIYFAKAHSIPSHKTT